MPNNTLVVHDTEYEMSPAYLRGAQAFRDSVPNNCNPHRFGSAAHDAWDYGHVNESVGEHLRYGEDLLAARKRGMRFEMDPAVPRTALGEVERDWAHAQLEKLKQAHCEPA